MDSKRMKILKNISKDSTEARYGGNSLLPAFIEWPVNSNQEKLTLVFSIPATFFNKNLGIDLDVNKWISVFSTYNDDYFLDEVIDNGDIFEESEKIFDNFTKVILHDRGKPRNESEYIIPSYLIEVNENILENSEETKIGGQPTFLQNEVKETKNMKLCLQFLANDLPEYKNILFLEDSIGYLFIDNDASDFRGIFFGQCT